MRTAVLLLLLSGKEVVYVIYKLIMVSSNLYSARKTLNTSTSTIIDILELGIPFFLNRVLVDAHIPFCCCINNDAHRIDVQLIVYF